MSNTIFLNLEQITLYGFQDTVSDLKVDAIIRGIEAGDDFTPVLVKKRNDVEYELGPFMDYEDEDNYGGHHRAVAHYIANVPLKCRLWENKYDPESLETPINIKDIIIADDKGQYEHARKWRNELKHWR